MWHSLDDGSFIPGGLNCAGDDWAWHSLVEMKYPLGFSLAKVGSLCWSKAFWCMLLCEFFGGEGVSCNDN